MHVKLDAEIQRTHRRERERRAVAFIAEPFSSVWITFADHEGQSGLRGSVLSLQAAWRGCAFLRRGRWI